MKKSKLVKIVVGIFVLVIIVLLVVLGMKLFSTEEISSVVTVYDEEKNVTTVYKNEKVIANINGMTITNRNMSDSVYYITDEDSKVYYLKENKMKQVGEKLSLITIASQSGAALLLNENGSLCRYTGSRLEKITDEDIEFAVISGDGETYAYYVDGTSYFGKKAGKEKEVKDTMITYMSSDGEIMYGISFDEGSLLSDEEFNDDYYDVFYWNEALYPTNDIELFLIDKKGNKKAIDEAVTAVKGLNMDGTEIAYTTEDGSYIMVNGKDTYKVSDLYFGYTRYAGNQFAYGHYNVVESFKDSLWSMSDYEKYNTCCYISDDYKAVVIAEDCDYILDVDSELSKVLYCSTNVELCLADVKENADVKILSKDVIDGKISADGEHIYYVSFEDKMELHYVDKAYKDSKLKTFDYYGGIYVVGNGCYLNNEEAYYFEGEEMNKIKSRVSLFVDEVAKKAYNMDEDKLYALDGAKEKALKGEYKLLSFYEIVQ